MEFSGSGPTLLLLLLLGQLEVRGQERGSLQEALGALNLPLATDEKPQLQKNHTGVLIAELLREVHCAERTGTSQDVCDKVRLIVTICDNFYSRVLSAYYLYIPLLPAGSKKHACYGWNVSECGGLSP